MRNILILPLLLLCFTVQAQSNYADSRSREDGRPETLAARSRFDIFIKKFFSQARARHGLTRISLVYNPRVIAQRARGAESAFKVLPGELERLLQFIQEARSHRQELVQKLVREHRALRTSPHADIEKAVDLLAKTKVIDLQYWGYFSAERMADYNFSEQSLSYFAHWNEGQSTYVPYAEKQMRSNVIRGLIGRLNYRPWYQDIF